MVTKKQPPEIPSRSLKDKEIPFEVLNYIPEESAAHYRFVPLEVVDNVLEVGVVDPENIEARDALQFISSKLNLPFRLFVISEEDFKHVLENYKNLKGEVTRALGEFTSTEHDEELEHELDRKAKKTSLVEEAPVTKIVAVIINHATEGNASDVHIEPLADRVRVRFRVDGVLYTSIFLPLNVHEAVVARIKILTNMKLDEKRKPQDGRFSARIGGRNIDFRVSSFPTSYGEKIALRILDPLSGLKRMGALGLSAEHAEALKKAIEKPFGMILVTGPTGSGKTTTLSAILHEFDRERYNVVSLEDPIEYNVDGVNQSQVRPEIEYTFASGLRSILRQDPDIIMVGEIRDKETAQLAVQAALTGHIVLSTLHTNNSVGVIPRLVDMGVDPYLIAPTLNIAIAQRLVKVLCPEKEEVRLEEAHRALVERQVADLPPKYREKFEISEKVYRAKRSSSCPGGTRGRMGVFEVLSMDRDLEELIFKTPAESEIYKLARSKGMLTMREDAFRKAFAGVIPFEEVYNV